VEGIQPNILNKISESLEKSDSYSHSLELSYDE